MHASRDTRPWISLYVGRIAVGLTILVLVLIVGLAEASHRVARARCVEGGGSIQCTRIRSSARDGRRFHVSHVWVGELACGALTRPNLRDVALS